jgi:hypothetical protein
LRRPPRPIPGRRARDPSHLRAEDEMKSRIAVSMAAGVIAMAGLASGCSQDAGPSKDVELAKVELPKGVAATPVSRPYKSIARGHSAPPAQQQTSIH